VDYGSRKWRNKIIMRAENMHRPPSEQCTNRPGCPCVVCTAPFESDELDRIAEEFIAEFDSHDQ
jgi:hypothetical protein